MKYRSTFERAHTFFTCKVFYELLPKGTDKTEGNAKKKHKKVPSNKSILTRYINLLPKCVLHGVRVHKILGQCLHIKETQHVLSVPKKL